MEKAGVRVGFAMCGSFCTFKENLEIIKALMEKGYDVTPIMSEMAFTTDTKFGKAELFNSEIEKITGNKIVHTIVEAEPFGPQALLDILVISPCTGNTLGKLANGITDTSVTMSAKAHLRNNRPLLIAISSNDAMSASAKNIGALQNTKNIFFVPYRQDNAEFKSTSLVANFGKIPQAIEYALKKEQIQPVLE